ncbi:uncharacterized protein LOC101813827 [Anopheles sinensis]|uniref:Uncharacterized protein LOC101813827 n=1 Tax=Anopheles sinensis TaxID=74873 RepID=A0A084VK38_ANOSI|nr:uncharacterized protein LOC101813827 [Anopheles sinensis]
MARALLLPTQEGAEDAPAYALARACGAKWFHNNSRDLLDKGENVNREPHYHYQQQRKNCVSMGKTGSPCAMRGPSWHKQHAINLLPEDHLA